MNPREEQATDREKSYSLDSAAEFQAELDRLPKQAAIHFPLERHGLGTATSLLDLGVGDGSFLALMHGAFPKLSLHGLDRNSKLLEIVRRRCPSAEYSCGDFENTKGIAGLLDQLKPNVVAARYVLQHVTPFVRSRLFDALRASTSRFRFICTDADDGLVQIIPPVPAISNLIDRYIHRQAAAGGDRLIGCRLAMILHDGGFLDVRATPLLLASQEVGVEAWWAAHGPALVRGLDRDRDAEVFHLYDVAERWIADNERDRSVWLSKVIHIVSGWNRHEGL